MDICVCVIVAVCGLRGRFGFVVLFVGGLLRTLLRFIGRSLVY